VTASDGTKRHCLSAVIGPDGIGVENLRGSGRSLSYQLPQLPLTLYYAPPLENLRGSGRSVSLSQVSALEQPL
jgi:hypothetical protein